MAALRRYRLQVRVSNQSTSVSHPQRSNCRASASCPARRRVSSPSSTAARLRRCLDSFLQRTSADVLDCLATYAEPVSVVGDLNVRLDRLDDSSAVQLVDVLADRGLSNHVTTLTHNLGGMLDVTRDDLPTPAVDVIDIGLSDHHLLQCSVPMSRPPPVYRSVDVRQWRLLDRDAFHAALSSSLLCNSDAWSNNDADDMALVYEREITSILDRMAQCIR